MTRPMMPTEEAGKPRVRPTAIVRAAIREAAAAGLEIEIRSDGTVTIRQPSPQSTGPKVAPEKEIVL